MTRVARLQIIGPIILFAVVLAAEGAAYALALVPSSGTLWYLNLKIFGLFQRSYYLLDSYTGMPHFELFFIALPILLLGYIGLIGPHRLLLAVSSNLSFVYTGVLAYCWFLGQQQVMHASLKDATIQAGPDFYLVSFLVAASLLSFCISHFVYARYMRIGR